MDKPDFFPIAVDVEEGCIYRWCGCGRSENKPFCDREDCGSLAVDFEAEDNETLYFCQCTKTALPPLCDGTHAKLMMEWLKKKDKDSSGT